MIYTTKELLGFGETEYSIRIKVKEKKLYEIERGFYCTKESELFKSEVFICKKYPQSIITGLSAFYFYNLTDVVPEKFYLASLQHSFPIRRKDVSQSYQESTFFEVGLSEVAIDGNIIKIYDLERLLIELIRQKQRYPIDLYYEVLNSYRKIKNQLNFKKINHYLGFFSNSKNLFLKIKEVL